MDLHENLAFATAVLTPQEQVRRELNDRDREALHRAFKDMRRALTGTAHVFTAVPHP